MLIHRRFRFSLVAAVLVAPLAHAQGAPKAPAAAAPQPPPASAAAPAAPATAAAPASPAAPAATPPAPPEGAPLEAAPQQGAPLPYYQEPSAETPQIYVAQPPLPPIEPRNRHFHDGFYLRLSAGYGYLGASTSLNNSESTASMSGSGTALDIMIGGTPAPGLVVGGGLLLQEAFDPGSSVTQRGGTVRGLNTGTSGGVGFAMLGPMIDAFPNPSGGFHFGGLIGLTEMGLRSNENNVSGGIGASIWTGYMWWASSQWSMGLMARFSLAWTSRRVGVDAAQFDATDMSRALGIMFSAAYH